MAFQTDYVSSFHMLDSKRKRAFSSALLLSFVQEVEPTCWSWAVLPVHSNRWLPEQSLCARHFERLGVREGLLIKKVPTEKVRALVEPQTHLGSGMQTC